MRSYVMKILREDASKFYAHYEEFLNEDPNGNIIDPQKDKLGARASPHQSFRELFIPNGIGRLIFIT